MIKKRIFYIRRIAILVYIIAIILLLLGFTDRMSFKPGGVLLMAALFPIGVMCHEKLQGYIFTAWVLMCASVAMFYPQAFIEWGGFRLELMIIPLTQIIMFGMGTTLNISDFTRIVKSPLPVFLGVLMQFCMMPIIAYFVGELFGFDGEIAAGIILIGSVSGGVASNVMVYLAKGNVPLSVTMTFASTMVAPLTTPFLMSFFAGTYVAIDPVQMMLSIFNMIIVPLVAGLVVHEILYSKESWARSSHKLMLIAAGFSALLLLLVWVGGEMLGSIHGGVILGSGLIAIVTLTKLVLNNLFKISNNWMDRLLPLISMIAICTIITVIIAQTHDVLMSVGITLLLAAIVHNGLGYFLGFWGSRFFGRVFGSLAYRFGLREENESMINEAESRTIAIEVGMQNGGMATGLAIDVLQSHVAALAPNLFGTWMNISGSMLANYWAQRPIEYSEGEEIKDNAVISSDKVAKEKII